MRNDKSVISAYTEMLLNDSDTEKYGFKNISDNIPLEDGMDLLL